MSYDRALYLVAAGIAGTVAIALLVVQLAGGADARHYSPGTPEAALQDYLAAWEDEDYDLAYQHFSSRVREGLTVEAYRRTARDFSQWGYADGSRRVAYIDRVHGNEARVRAELTIEEVFGEGLGAGSYRDTRSIRLVREDGTWKVDDPLVWLDPGPLMEY